MSIEEKVSLTISITKSYRDQLRTLAAQQNVQNPDLLTTASSLAREIVCGYLDNIDQIDAKPKLLQNRSDRTPGSES